MARWKRHELQIAKAIGGTRNGATGAATADVESDWLCIEAKSWKGSVRRVEAALKQAERAADDGQLPIAVIHTVGRPHRKDLCIMRWGDFLDWFGDVQPVGETVADAVDAAANGDDEAQQWLAICAPDLLEEAT